MAGKVGVIVWCAPRDLDLGERCAKMLADQMEYDTWVYAFETTDAAEFYAIKSGSGTWHEVTIATRHLLDWQQSDPYHAVEWRAIVNNIRAFPDSKCVVLRNIPERFVPDDLTRWPSVAFSYRPTGEEISEIIQILNPPLHHNAHPEISSEPQRFNNAVVSAGRASVFISYAHADRVFEQRLYSDLQAAQIYVWVDHENLSPGTLDWQKEIRHAITASTGVIYIGSEDGADSGYVGDELNIARDEQIPVYPIWARGVKWSRCAPLGWGRVQYADGRGNNYDSAVQAIIASLKKANGSA